MKTIVLGNTGLEVTELCFGALPIGPAQRNTPTDEAARVMSLAIRSGINFIDTAQMYRTYEPLAKALRETDRLPVISSKSTAATYEDMDSAVHEALETLRVERIDIFFLHAARVDVDVFEKRSEALRCLLDHKKKGTIGFTGISAHAVDVINLAAKREDIDVVFAILNKSGMGILRGDRSDMERAIGRCLDAGKGVMLMKVLAGGNLLDEYEAAVEYARGVSQGRAAIALGMVTEDEVRANVQYWNSGEFIPSAANQKKMLVFGALCKACGKCCDACHSDAISLETGRAVIDAEKCLKCGYCVASCPEFAIRVV